MFITLLATTLAIVSDGCWSDRLTPTLKPTTTPMVTMIVSPNTSLPSSLPDIVELVEAVKSGVACIIVGTVTFDMFLEPVSQRAAGSRAVIGSRGYIVTNHHVSDINYMIWRAR